MKIKTRLSDFALDYFGEKSGTVHFKRGVVHVSNKSCAFETLVKAAYMARIQLSATGFYKTPKIH